MKAAIIHEHGDADRIVVEDIARPKLAAGEALVKVHAAALNHLDIWTRKGGRAKLSMPHVLGSDAAGVVAEVAPDVRGLEVGDEVVVYSGLSCGRCEFCRAGQQSQCVEFGIVGLSRPGTFAEYVALPAANLLAKPPELTFAQAAAMSLAYLTAWRMVFSRARLLPGQTVLIHGVGGGVALAALQLARLCGARAIVTSSSADKLRRAEELGAAHGINYRSQDVAQAVLDLTAGRGVDAVIDTVGGATFGVSLASLRKGGRVVLCGVTGGAEAPADLRSIYWRQLEVLGSTFGTLDEFRQLLTAAGANALQPIIDVTLPLAKAREATVRMEAAEQFGKIVLDVA